MRSVLVPALVLLLASPSPAQKAGWMPFAAKADGFSILMPAAPHLMTQAAEGITTRMYLATTPPFYCVASKSRLPASFGKANVDAMTVAMRESMLRSAGATATGGGKATFGGIVGDRTDFKTVSGRAGSAWIARVPGAVYFLVVAKEGGASAAESGRFFNSFRRSR